MRLWTARYANRALARAGVAPVGITLGRPQFRTPAPGGAHIRELAPGGSSGRRSRAMSGGRSAAATLTPWGSSGEPQERARARVTGAGPRQERPPTHIVDGGEQGRRP